MHQPLKNTMIQQAARIVALLLPVCCSWASFGWASENHTAYDFSSMPISITQQGVKPKVMINASQDHQLYFKAYDDYSDLDNDSIPETTYKHSFNYYGYFDSFKCYTYNTTNNRFEPRSFTTDKYCYSTTAGDNDASKGEWSGNFLNWVAMARIDSIRKILFGGHRRIDTATDTTLERSFLPHDAHSWAKFYAGADLVKLTPFKPATSASSVGLFDYLCDDGNAMSAAGVVNPICMNANDDPHYYACSSSAGATNPAACADTADPYNYNCADNQNVGSAGYNACKNISIHDPRYRRNRYAYNSAEDYQDVDWDGTPVDRRKVGITFGNTTDVNNASYPGVGSEKFTEPPLIKVVRENYTLWGSNEATQISWGSGTNANSPAKSWIPAYPSSPSWSARLGEGNYIARVQACVPGLIDSALVDGVTGSTKEKCKLYPGPDKVANTTDDNYKPIGLLQDYGDDDQMLFGMIAGSYTKHTAGGQLISNIRRFADEVNVASDGTFPKVARFASASSPLTENELGEGIVNAWSLYRIIHYQNGNYNNASLGNCPWGLSKLSDLTNDSRCQDWGNPFAEIFLQSIKYLSNGSAISDYTSTKLSGIPGLPGPAVPEDPFKGNDYCAQINVINLNSSVISYDYDQLDGSGYGPQTIWDPAVLPGAKNTTAMTNVVGAAEGMHGKSYFIGGIDVGGTSDNQLCTSKNLVELGKAGGLCPEAPRLYGSYRIAGLAYYAHTRDIRPETSSTGLLGDQVVNTYAVALASGVPVIQIPDPEQTTNVALATILPACRNASLSPQGNCAIVDFKIVEQMVDPVKKQATGRFYIDWEDSEQGGDYDQDMWGTLDYVLDKVAGTLTITTQVQANSAGYALGFGYVLGGTSDDGFHVHSGIVGYKNTETADAGYPDCSDADGCNCAAGHGPCNTPDSSPSRKTYALASSSTKLLKDPLWYAAKWGGFVDQDENKLPNLVEEWDSKINATGGTGSDGIPDNYYYATNPRQLEESLERVFKAILERSASSTSTSIVTSNLKGEGALLQANYEPLKKSADKEVRWLGTVQALWLDSSGFTRQDCSPPVGSNGFDSVTGKCLPSPSNYAGGVCTPNGRLDNYCVDQVVESYYDTLEKKTRARVYESDVPDSYTTYSMQGVVRNYSGGAVIMDPNSMEGTAVYVASPESIMITPYTLIGKVTTYDPDSGLVVMKVTSWSGPSGKSYSTWGIGTSAGGGQGVSIDALTPVVNQDLSFTVSPTGSWLGAGDTITLKTKNLIGASGEVFYDWDVECLDSGNNAVGTIEGVRKQLNNVSDDSFSLTTVSGDFTGCTRAKVSSYDLNGTAGKSYSQWAVANLGTLATKGTSSSMLLLGNSGSRSFMVSPTSDWLQAGDQLLVSNRNFTTMAFADLSYLWNAREQLYLPSVSDTQLAANRDWKSASSAGRYITTWVDADLDGIIDPGEYRAFDSTMLDTFSYSFFDVADAATATSVINYIRGIESADSRNRTLKYASTDAESHVMRLGDVVHSTPVVVRSPQEAFNILYEDMSYRNFFQQYINRRVVVYVGGNDGLLHAFNGGFYNQGTENAGTVNAKKYIEYSTTGKAWNGVAAVSHPLGGELWAYAPFNLLPHLQWLKDPDYGKWTHVYFMDASPRIFDAKIFSPDPDHPSGWGTVMVVGMQLGGGAMTVNVDNDNNSSTDKQVVKTRSAYVIFDITNPEIPPQLLAELPMPDGSFSTVQPAVAAFQDVGSRQRCQDASGAAVACNNWYLLFGNGPDSLDYVSSQNGKLYLFDLSQLRTKTPTPALAASGLPANCTIQALNTEANLMACDTAQANSFMGTPAVVDWGLDFMANTAYFGLIGRETSGETVQDNGRVMRLGFNNTGKISSWDPLVTFYDAGKPVVGQPVLAIDNLKKHWLFFGTGRYLSTADKSTTDAHYLYGVKDTEDGKYPVDISSLLDVSSATVYTDGSLSPPVAPITGPALSTFSALEKEIDTEALGWRRYLGPIVGAAADPSTRNHVLSTLYAGVLLSPVFQPSSDPCAGEGQSRLFGLYYKTGTPHPKYPIFTPILVPGGTATSIAPPYAEDSIPGPASGSIVIPSDKGNGTLHVGGGGGEDIQIQFSTTDKKQTGRTSWEAKE